MAILMILFLFSYNNHMESKRLSKPSYALSYEKNMINHTIKATFIYSCEFKIIKNRNMKLNMK